MSEQFDDLIKIMQRLRGPNGCPWDKEQTPETLKTFLLEETYELLDALESGEVNKIEEELGDLLFQVVFLSQVYSEENHFSINDVIQRISDKLVRRHPHVFQERSVSSSKEVLKIWNEIKGDEKSHDQTKKLLDGIVKNQPALLRAHQISSRAVHVGFEWESIEDVVAKVEEETAELKKAIDSSDSTEQAEEVGDMLFTLVNIARHLNLNAEIALHKTSDKFTERFGYVEDELKKRGRSLQESTLDEMEQLWQAAKQNNNE